MDASYQLEMGGGSNLFLGIKAGATSKNTDIEGLERITNVSNPSIATNGTAIFPVFGFGALFKSEKFYISASIPNFLNPEKFVKDDAFIGSRCIVVEGIRVGKEAVLGANVVLTASSKIIDVTGSEPVEFKGYVPERSVVIPGSYVKKFPAGEFNVPCAMIIGQRKASTDKKTSLNAALRENNVAV